MAAASPACGRRRARVAVIVLAPPCLSLLKHLTDAPPCLIHAVSLVPQPFKALEEVAVGGVWVAVGASSVILMAPPCFHPC